MEEFFIELLKEYGYIILFVWCIMEGEMALIMAGILSLWLDLEALWEIKFTSTLAVTIKNTSQKGFTRSGENLQWRT